MTPINYEHFYRFGQIETFLRERGDEHSGLMELDVLGRTPEERPIYLVTITDRECGPPENKPAYYIQAGLHASEGAGPMVTLQIIDSLLSDSASRETLQRIVFYIVPCATPDGLERALTGEARVRSRYEENASKNGLVPGDIDGDGKILNMRIQHPAGPLKEDPEDPRNMIRRNPGDTDDPFYFLLTEGIVRDYDGSSIADIVPGISQYDFNRNWPIDWRPKDNAARYPFSEPETRVLGDFLTTHENIFAGVDLHCGNNAIMRPTSRPDSEINQDDLKRIIELAETASQMTGFPVIQGRNYRAPWAQPIVLPGTANDFAYFRLGISFLLIELGNGYNSAGIPPSEFFPADTQTREREFMRRVLAFHDERKSDIFTPWRKFDHPQLGEVELGGLRRGEAYYMYPPDVESIAPKVASFTRYHAGLAPRISLVMPELTRYGEDLYRIRVTVCNHGAFDTDVMTTAVPAYVSRPVRVDLSADEEIEVVSRVKRFEIPSLKARESRLVEWFVKSDAPGTFRVTAEHPKAGRTVAKLKP